MLARRLKRIAAASLSLIPLTVYAMVPATPEERLCIDEHNSIVVARVEDGAGEDCRLKYNNLPCSPDNYVRLSIKITEVLAVGTEDPVFKDRRSEFIDGKIADVIGRRVAIHAGVINSTYPNGDLVGPTLHPLTDEDTRRLYVGERFIFSISPSFEPTPHWATVWPLNSRQWVLKTLHAANGAACPRPVPGV